ncbi:MAG: adenylate/guanylate cyclase domain-containing protein [Spirochaetia bacterium]
MRVARTILAFVLPLVAAAILGILGSLGVLARVDGQAYDRFLRFRPAAPARQAAFGDAKSAFGDAKSAFGDAATDILLVDIDPQAGSLAGLLADGLVVLKEMDARYAVLDLPLAQKSPPALDPGVLRQTLPNALDREFSQMEDNIQSLFDAIRRGSVRPRDAARYVSDLVGLVGKAKERLSGSAMGIERDDDALLGQSAAFFSRVYVPLGLLSTADFSASPELVDLTLQRQSIPVRVTDRDPSFHAGGIRPAVLPIVRGARGGGFPSDAPDPDDVRRSTRLLAEVGGQHVGQLALAAALDMLGNPAVEVSPGRVLLRGAGLPAGKASITIPIAENGQMLLDWPRAAAGDGFRHLAWDVLSQERRLEDSLVSDLRDLDAKGYLTYLRSPEPLLDVYEEGGRLGRGMLAAGNDSDADQWRAVRGHFFQLCGQFLDGDAEKRILADADRELQSGALSEDEKSLVRAERDRVPTDFTEARQVLARLMDLRGSLRDSLAGAFCIVSVEPAEGTVRPALTPFGAPATDARASAALVSTLLSGRFLHTSSAGIPFLAAAIFSLLLAFAVRRMAPFPTFLVGLGAAAAALAGLGAVLAGYGLFVAPAAPVLSLMVTGTVMASLKLAWFRGASRTVRAAFAGRVSTESLRLINAARARLAPEGSSQDVSILCIADREEAAAPSAADPGEALRRLRTHRAAMREAIVGLGGMLAGSGAGRTTAFFGAPVESEDHARRACLAALRLQALERELNGTAPSVFASRMGIHSGTCVAGFLGSPSLPDYTVAGPPAALAARLEALNESFGTSIIVSERVREAAGPGLPVRVLGTVAGQKGAGRIRIYELRAEEAGAEARLIAEFEEGLARYERGDVSGALAIFTQVLAASPGDGPSAAYAFRCRLKAAHPDLDVTSFPW